MAAVAKKKSAKAGMQVWGPELARALRQVKAVASNAVPAYRVTRIRRERRDVYLETTDGIDSVRVFLDAEVVGKFDGVAAIDDLQSAVKGVKDLVRLEVHAGQVTVRIGRRVHTCMEVEAVPMIDIGAEQGEVVLHAVGRDLDTAVQFVTQFIAEQGTAMALGRPPLTNVCLDTAEQWPRLVGTDAHTLANTACPGRIGEGLPSRLLIPGKVLARAVKGLGDEDGVKVERLDGRRLLIRTQRAIYRVRGEADYPEWRSLIPPASEFELTVTVDRDALLAAATQAKGVLGRNLLKFRVDPKVDGLQLYGESESRRTFADTLDAEIVASGRGGIEIAFNPEYVRRAAWGLDSEEDDRVRIGLNGPLRPAMFWSDDDQVLIMPIRIHRNEGRT